MKTYKSNYKYQLTLLILIVFSVFIFISSGIWTSNNISVFNILIIAALFAVWSLFLFCLPKEIRIKENTIGFKTLAGKKTISFSQIKSVKPYYSTKSKIWHGGNEEKASMLCIVQLKGSLFKLFIVTDAISEYKELYRTIKAKIEIFQGIER